MSVDLSVRGVDQRTPRMGRFDPPPNRRGGIGMSLRITRARLGATALAGSQDGGVEGGDSAVALRFLGRGSVGLYLVR